MWNAPVPGNDLTDCDKRRLQAFPINTQQHTLQHQNEGLVTADVGLPIAISVVIVDRMGNLESKIGNPRAYGAVSKNNNNFQIVKKKHTTH